MSAQPVTDLELMLYADGELGADRVADVEAELARSPRARDVVASIRQAGELVRADADSRAAKAGADGIVGDVMAAIGAGAGGRVIPLRGGERNGGEGEGHSSWLYAVGGLAAAAAVALAVWSIAGPGLAPQAVAPPPVPTVPSAAGAEMATARVPAPDFDPEPTVSVDAVDFGARTGTIFYVPADRGTTTIVWLSDDESGGK